MKVVYDISVLGSGTLDPKARTGVYRVVENLALALMESSECEVSFCAGGSTFHPLFGALEYLKKSPPISARPFLSGSGRARASQHLLSRLLSIRSPDALGTGLAGRVVQGLAGRAVSAVAGQPFPIPSKLVAGADVFHSPYAPLPRWDKGAAPARVLTVHDLIAIKWPELYEPHVEHHDRAVLNSITAADVVTCVSEATRDDLCEHTGISPDRVHVTHLAASRELFQRRSDPEELQRALIKYSLPETPYILALGTLKPGKNFATTISAFARLVSSERIQDLSLVLVGVRGWDVDAIFAAALDANQVRGRIHFTGFVEDADLATLYSGATAFVFPSLYEGFGLPALEAMQCGVPVVASNTSSLPEVVGDAGILVDPKDVDGFCDALLKLHNDPGLRSELSAKALARAGKFSWKKCAAETIEAYRHSIEG
jgi:glycosyltransferase involved in cell wall biosynthesis